MIIIIHISFLHKIAIEKVVLVHSWGFEPKTFRSVDERSIQLSYECKFFDDAINNIIFFLKFQLFFIKRENL